MLTLHHVATELVSKGHEVRVFDDVNVVVVVDDVVVVDVVVVSLDLWRPKL